MTQIKKSWLDWAVLVVAFLYGAPGFTISIWGFARTDMDAAMPLFSLDSIIFLTSVFGGGLLGSFGFIFGIARGCQLGDRFQARFGPPIFAKTTDVSTESEGLLIIGLGLCSWKDILGWEGIPDSENRLVVHTEPYGTLMLHLKNDNDELVEALHHYCQMARVEIQK